MAKNQQVKLNGMLWIEYNGEKMIGPGRVELLRQIQVCGSIRQAAIQMGMSYRKAWDLIEHMNNGFDEPVVISNRGGKGGGQATVTEKGIEVIDRFSTLYQKFQDFLRNNSFDI